MSTVGGRTRLAVVAAVALICLLVGSAAGAAGTALIIGASNSAGTAQTVLSGGVIGAVLTLKGTSPYSTGVFGWTSATSGGGRGVYGRSDSSAGVGVFGKATRTGDGVRGELTGVVGAGVHGVVTRTDNIGDTYGVWGENLAANGIGVYGSAPTHGSTIGGLFVVGEGGSSRAVVAMSVSGLAIYAHTGGAISILADSPGSNAIAVQGQGGSQGGHFIGGPGVSNYGVWAKAPGSGTGALGWSVSGTGVMGRSDSGDVLAGMTDSGVVFRVTNGGDVRADGTFIPGGADVAELLPAVEETRTADVLVIGPDGRLRPCTAVADSAVAGVRSTRPGILGGARSAESDGRIALAVLGVVPVHVTAAGGAIRPGDLLTTSAVAGHAMRAGTNPAAGTILGKALGSLASGTGTIEVLLLLQ